MADVMAGRWIPVTAHDDGLGKDEALFLSRSFSKSTRAHGDVIWMVCWTRDRKMTFRWPWQRNLAHDNWHEWSMYCTLYISSLAIRVTIVVPIIEDPTIYKKDNLSSGLKRTILCRIVHQTYA